MTAFVRPWVCGCREWQIDALSDTVGTVKLVALVREAIEEHVRHDCPVRHRRS